MTEGPTDASSKLRLVLDYLPCEACLSQPVKDQELLCSVCRRLDRDVDVTTVRRVTVLLERPTPVYVAPAPPAPLPPPEETPVPAPVEEPSAVVGVDVLTEELREETPAPVYVPPGEVVAAEPEPIVEVERQEEPPEAAPEPAPEPPAKKRGFSLFRRKAEEPAPEEPAFDDVAGFEPRDDSFEFVREEAPLREVQDEPEATFDFTRPEERPAEAAAPARDELEDDFLYRSAPEPARDSFLLEEEPVEAPREEIPVEPAEDENPWAPPGERVAEEPAWPNETREPEPDPFFAPEPEEEILETELVEDEPAPSRWAPEPAPEEEEILETEIVEMEVLPDDEPEPARAPAPVEPEPARPAEEKKRGFSSMFKRGKVEEERAPARPEPPRAAEPEVPADARTSAWAPAEAAPADELMEAAPAPAAAVPESDLYRLAGFERGHQEALARERIESISHLSGHDPVELAARTGVPADALTRWVQVADLAHEVGVPLEAALALVAAGVPGPRGLRDMDARDVVDKAAAPEAGVTFQNVKRWKRRA